MSYIYPNLRHFLLEPPVEVCFSGGRTSALMLHLFLKAHNWKLPDGYVVEFENTGEECEETLAFIHRVEMEWCVPIVWLEWNDEFREQNYLNKSGDIVPRRKPYERGEGFRVVNFYTASRKGEPYDAMLDYYHQFRNFAKQGEGFILPTVPNRMCTAHLKIKTGSRYMRWLGYKEFDAAIGIRKDEPKRWAKMMAQNVRGGELFDNVLPLWSAGITKPEVNKFWKEQAFDLELDQDSERGNCKLCFLKAKHKIIRIMREEFLANGGQPTDEILRWTGREFKAGMSFRIDRPDYRSLLQEAMSDSEIEEKDESIVDCICG